jgi:tellurite resistance protein TerC
MDNLINHPWIIAIFFIVVLVMLLLDLGIFNKKSHIVTNKEAVIWSLVWIGISMMFSGLIYTMSNELTNVEKFFQFQTAYWIEKALSVDNLFVFILVFNYFNVPREYHHRVLFWGIIGALVMRAIFIFSGVGMIKMTYIDDILQGKIPYTAYIILSIIAGLLILLGLYFARKKAFSATISLFVSGSILLVLLNVIKLYPTIRDLNIPHINILLTAFGLFLIYAGVKSWFVEDDDDEEKDFSTSPGAKFVYRLFKVSKEFDKDRFFTVENGVKLATPLLVVVGVIEFTDLLFAVDSIPAIFSIFGKNEPDPFILYTSNIFAILGLRSLYFLLSNFIHMFSRLKYGLAIILAFIGTKMVIAPFFHISSTASLSVVGGILIFSVLASILFPVKDEEIREG